MDIAIIILGLTFGLTSSLHCIGMCGPIALSLGINATNKAKFIIRNLTYQLGRVTTYSIFGLFFGLIGQSISIVGAQNYVSIALGCLMILLIIIPRFYENDITYFKFINRFMLRIKGTLSLLLKKKKISSLFYIGLLNGFLPCSTVYASLTISTAFANISKSLLFMFSFGLGTIPLMFLTVYFGQFVSINQRKTLSKALPILTFGLGMFFILRGLGLNIPYISPSENSLKFNSQDIHCN